VLDTEQTVVSLYRYEYKHFLSSDCVIIGVMWWRYE